MEISVKIAQFRASHVLRAGFLATALGLGITLTTSTAHADDESSQGNSLIDILIDWIDEFFDPEVPAEPLPSEGDGW